MTATNSRRGLAPWLVVLGFISFAAQCGEDTTPIVPEEDNPQTAPQLEGDYLLPWADALEPVMVLQGNRTRPGRTHFEGGWEQFAFDFDLPEGDPVLAAREGTVTYVKDNFENSHCGGPELEDEPNLVVVDHGDGTSGQYLHLQKSASVIPGQSVVQGQMLGRAGKTGNTGCRPHLHFQVHQNDSVTKLLDGTEKNCTWSCESKQICFADVTGCIPQERQAYRSQNQVVMVEGMQVTRQPTAALAEEDSKCPPSKLLQIDARSVADWLACAVLARDAVIIGDLIGNRGASYAPYAVGLPNTGQYTADEIASALQIELDASNPTCTGYDILYDGLPDKLSVWFDGIALDIDHFGDGGPGLVNFLFFKFDENWELWAIGAGPTYEEPEFSSNFVGCFEDLPGRATLPPSEVGPATEVIYVSNLGDSKMILENGVGCGYLGGGTRAFGQDRLNYICEGDWWLLGEPTMGRVWSIRAAILSADLTSIVQETRFDIRTIWYWEN